MKKKITLIAVVIIAFALMLTGYAANKEKKFEKELIKTEENINKLRDIGGEELAPAADRITEENIKKLRDLGLGVRAWGVSNVGLMKKMCELEVDGMTVNFPDRLFEYMCKNVCK